MPTKILVPRASGEGGMGVVDNAWGHAYFDSGNFKTGDFSDSIMISGLPLDQAITQGGLGGKWDDGTTAGDIYYNGGSVGIGTADPSYQFQVGNLSATHSNDIAACFVGSTPQNDDAVGIQFGTDIQSCMSRIYAKVQATNNSMLQFQTMGDGLAETRMVINNTGNVGIGTTSPSARLEINSSGGNQYALKAARADGTRLAAIFQDNNLNGTIGAYNAADNPKVWLNTNGNSYFQGGNVGIGTVNPSAGLEIHKPEGDESFATYAVDTNGAKDKRLRVYSNAHGTVLGLQDGGQDIIVLDGRTQTPNSSFFNGGNVGIGTTSPAQKLEVSNGGTSLEYLFLKDISGGTSNKWTLGTESNSSLQFNFQGQGNPEIVISDGGDMSVIGKLCVGDTTATKQFDVNGPIRVRGTMPGVVNDNEAFDEMRDGNASVNLTDQGHRSSLSIGASLGDQTVSSNNSGLYIGAHGGGAQISNDFVKSAIHFDNHYTNPKGVRIFTGTGSSQIEERMRITKDGNVGIGTTSPEVALMIRANSNGDGLLKLVDEATYVEGEARSLISLQGNVTDGTRQALGGIEAYGAPNSRGGLRFSCRATSGGSVTKMVLNEDGNVGIGTTGPSAPLEVTSTSGGVIMPRMTTAQRNAISSPTDGEMVYDTNDNKFYGRANGSWVALH